MPNTMLDGSGRIRSVTEFTDWFDERHRRTSFDVTPIPFRELRGWSFEPDTGNLRHDSGRFFSVEGVRVRSASGPVAEWAQPIIVQPEFGILGIAVREIDGELHALMQAKMEPGNVNGLQLSPTVQATQSNYTRVHEGGNVKYLDYFTGRAPARVLIDVLQSEQGSWFLQKRNRNVIVEVGDEPPPDEDFRWVPMRLLWRLLHEDNVLNMNTRSVLAHLPLVAGDRAGALPEEGGDGFQGAVAGSFAADASSPDELGALLDWLTDVKARRRAQIERVPLAEVERWHRTPTAVTHEEERFFQIIAVNVQASTREVRSWTQPLLAPTGLGISAFLVRRVRGVLQVLVRAGSEAGLLDVAELSPTVQVNPANYRGLPAEARPPFLDLVLNADPAAVRFDAVLSEEGGRFQHAQNRYMVVEVGEGEPAVLPPDYRWATLHQLTGLLRHSLYLNMQARTLVACLNAVR